MVNIYTLSDANTGNVFYVGATAYKLNERMNQHISKKSKPILYDPNVKPVIELIETVEAGVAGDTENYWIEQFRSWGFTLLNSKKAGKYTHEKPPKIKLSIALSKESQSILDQICEKEERSVSYIISKLIYKEAQLRGVKIA